jgi:hypothetical protein
MDLWELTGFDVIPPRDDDQDEGICFEARWWNDVMLLTATQASAIASIIDDCCQQPDEFSMMMKSERPLTIYGLKDRIVLQRGDASTSLKFVEAKLLAEELRSASRIAALHRLRALPISTPVSSGVVQTSDADVRAGPCST